MDYETGKSFKLSQRFQTGKFVNLPIKLVLTFTLLIAIPVLVIGSITYFMNLTSAKHRAVFAGPLVLDEISLNINLLMDNIETVSAQIGHDPKFLNYLTSNLPVNSRKQTAATIHKFFEPWLTNNQSIGQITVLRGSGGTIETFAESHEVFGKMTGSTWYGKAIALNGKPLWVISPSQTKTKNHQLRCIRFIAPGQSSSSKFFLVVTIKQDALNHVFSRALFAGGGKVYLISPDNRFFRVNQPFRWDSRLKGNRDRIMTKVIGSVQFQKETSSIGQFEIQDGKNTQVFFQRLNTPGWSLCGLIFKEEYTGPVSSMASMLWGIGIVLVLLGIWGGFVFSRKLTTAINTVISAFRTVESGDLTRKLLLQRKDEIGAIAVTFNTMIDNYRELIINVDDIVVKLNDLAGKIIAVSHEVTESSVSISDILEEVAESASEQANDAFRCVSSMNTLTGCIRIVNDCTPLIQQIKSDILQLTSKGKVVLENLETKSEETKHITVAINRLIYALSEKTEEIQDIVSQIKGIVNETSMISLNATIEATRIKHINKEVTALANDVKKHVDYSVVATKKITDVIQSIEIKTIQATEMASVADHAVDSQNAIILKCAEIFNEISNSSDTLVARFETVITLMENIETNKNEIMNLTEGISSETEEIAAMTEELNASSQEQRNSMDNLTVNADQLKEFAANLTDAIRQFTV